MAHHALPTGDPTGIVGLVAAHPKGTALLLAVSVAGWTALAWIALDMGHPLAQLTMPAEPQWALENVAAVFAMWAVMMAAMMLPSALPMTLTFVQLSAQQDEHLRGRMFVAGYLLVWIAFSAAATALQWTLQAMDWIEPMQVASTSKALTVALLFIAGAYQFSPLKRLCLARCRTPIAFLMGEWRSGVRGAFLMGWKHGALCLGCCWALMALLFVGGTMNIGWVAAVAVAVAIEKLVPRGERIASVLGLALIAAGLARLAGLWLFSA
jgi:predicted metal-binding membrane protein